jgi:lycopene cyclase domain-containing protein
MATYLILNIVFLLVTCGVLWALGARWRWHSVWLTIVILCLFTAVFDSLIVWSGIVAYDSAKILGIFIGQAPIEDFFYALLAGSLIPGLWHILGDSHERKN